MNVMEMFEPKTFKTESAMANQLMKFSNNPGEKLGLGIVEYSRNTTDKKKTIQRMLKYKHRDPETRLPMKLLRHFDNNAKKGIFLQNIISAYETNYPTHHLEFRIIGCRKAHVEACPPPPRLNKGGKIPKAGMYILHKGEVVVPAHRVKTVDGALKKAGLKPLGKKCNNCVMTAKQLNSRKVSEPRKK